MNENNPKAYVAPTISDHEDAIYLTQGEGDTTIEENIVWGNNAAPVGLPEEPLEESEE